MYDLDWDALDHPAADHGRGVVGLVLGTRVCAQRVARRLALWSASLACSGNFARWNGSDFLVTASDRIGNQLEVYSARIDASATLVEGPDVLRVMPVWETYGSPSAAMTPAGDLLMVYPLWAGNPYNAPRIQGELFDFGPPMPGDLDGDAVVGIIDFLMLLGAWGPCPPGDCPADLDGDGVVGIVDLLTLLANWS